MALPIPLIAAGIELLSSTMSDNKDENEKKVVEVLEKVTDNRPFWLRKTWWSMIIAVLIPVINKTLGLELSQTEIITAVSPLVAFILSESHRKKS